MAWIETVHLAGGDQRFKVKWRQSGAGAPTVSLDDPGTAERFKTLVELHGNRWPGPAALRDAGFGFLPQAHPDDPGAGGGTLVAAIGAYLDGGTRKRASADTIAEYRQQLDRDIAPYFGRMLLVDVHRAQLAGWQEWMVGTRGLSVKSVANVRGALLNPVLVRAMTRGDNGEPALRDYNPLDGLALPVQHTRYVRAMLESRNEADIFLDAALEIDPEAYALLLTKLGVGLRWGEVAALPPWAVHINPDTFAGKLEIAQVAARRRGKRETDEALWYIRAYPKTPAGFRTLPVHPRVGRVLAHRLATASELIFTNTAGKLWYSSTFHTNRWTPILKLARANGLPRDITPHGLRKSMISLLYESKVDPVTAANVSGHKNPATGLKLYTAPTERQHEQVRDALTDLLGAA